MMIGARQAISFLIICLLSGTTSIVGATAPGQTAADGSGRNSPYTKHLLRYTTEPNLTIEAVLRTVMRAVEAETRERQVPWYSSATKHEFYFVE